MPNADSSEYTRLKKLAAQSNDSTGAVATIKFRGPSPVGILPSPIKFSLSKFLPQMRAGIHSIAAAQHESIRRRKRI
jgi:hypothetical protein